MSFVREKKWISVGLSVVRRGPDIASEVCAKWRDQQMSQFLSPEAGTSLSCSLQASRWCSRQSNFWHSREQQQATLHFVQRILVWDCSSNFSLQNQQFSLIGWTWSSNNISRTSDASFDAPTGCSISDQIYTKRSLQRSGSVFDNVKTKLKLRDRKSLLRRLEAHHFLASSSFAPSSSWFTSMLPRVACAIA